MADMVNDVALSLLILDATLTPETATAKATSNLGVAIPPVLPYPGFITHRRNLYGIPETVMRCQVCGCIYSVTPALQPEETSESVCLSPDCESYDVTRDVDLSFGLGEVALNREAGYDGQVA